MCARPVDLLEAPSSHEIALARRTLLERCGQPDATVLLYSGRLSPEKHVLALPRIMAEVLRRTPPAHLVIAGDGPLRHRLESEGRALAGGRIHVLGHVDRSALWRLLHACDIFIHPNPCKPFGLGPLEAMVAGAPVVAPETGGLRAYATHDNAWLSAAPPTAMASTLMACLNDPAEAEPARRGRAPDVGRLHVAGRGRPHVRAL